MRFCVFQAGYRSQALAKNKNHPHIPFLLLRVSLVPGSSSSVSKVGDFLDFRRAFPFGCGSESYYLIGGKQRKRKPMLFDDDDSPERGGVAEDTNSISGQHSGMLAEKASGSYASLYQAA
jgi:hypothetical protein